MNINNVPQRLSEAEWQAMADVIVGLMMEKGLKSTTMDEIASRLQMSKRTLYEIFGSKSEMLRRVLAEIADKHQEFIHSTFENAENALDAMLKIFMEHRDMMKRVNVNFFRDMDRFYKDERKCYDEQGRTRHDEMMKVFELGVSQGMFRADADYDVQARIMTLQMESLKRMEEFFPPDIELIRVYDAIILGFLRSIASPKGMKILDDIAPTLSGK